MWNQSKARGLGNRCREFREGYAVGNQGDVATHLALFLEERACMYEDLIHTL